MELQHLRLLRAIAARGSLTEAGELLGYSQPSVSRHLAQIELELGKQLVQRNKAGATLTPAGLVLLRHADAVFERLTLAQNELGQLADLPDEPVRLAASSGLMAGLIPGAVRSLRKAWPELQIVVQLCDTWSAMGMVRDGVVDVAVSMFFPEDLRDVGPGQPQVTSLFVDTMHCVLPVGHRLADHAVVPLERLAQESWLMRRNPHCPAVRTLTGACARVGFSPRPGVGVDNVGALLGLVSLGAGVGLLSSTLSGAGYPGVVFRPLDVAPRLEAAVLSPGSGARATVSSVVAALGGAIDGPVAVPASVSATLPIS